MADEEDLVEIDINEWKKLKVAELRQRMTEIGLETKGTKAELIARVERYLNEQEADLLEDEGEEEEEEEEEEEDVKGTTTITETTQNNKTPKDEKTIEPVVVTSTKTTQGVTNEGIVKIEFQLPPPGQPIPTLTSPDTTKPTPLSDTDRLKKRGDRFGVTDNLMSKKLSRAERFGTDVSSVLGKRSGGDILSTGDMEKLKKRSQRFGSAGGSSVINKMEVTEKKKARADRFNLSAVDFSVEDRKVNRSQRFGTKV